MEDLSDTVETYESVVDQYRERHADRSVVEDQIERFLSALAAAGIEDARILDAGCGPGWESATVAERGHRPVGIDLTPAFLEVAREEAPRAGLARMDMRTLGFVDDSFDGIWACASFLHVPREDAPATLEGFRRVLRPGGVVHFAVKRGEGTREGDGYESDSRQFTLYRPGEFESLVEAAGFEAEYRETDENWIALTARL